MKLDKYNLLIEDDITKAAYNTSKFFIEGKFKKEEVDKKFAFNHPHRRRTQDESFEEYDDYLTAHTRAYETMLEKQGLGYLMNLDINFNYMIQTLSNGKGFIVHPDAISIKMDRKTSILILSAIMLYGFDTKYLHMGEPTGPHNQSLMCGRKDWRRYISDAVAVVQSYITNDSTTAVLKEVSKRFNPTFLTKFIK